jgi:hypothetical protein
LRALLTVRSTCDTGTKSLADDLGGTTIAFSRGPGVDAQRDGGRRVSEPGLCRPYVDPTCYQCRR